MKMMIGMCSMSSNVIASAFLAAAAIHAIGNQGHVEAFTLSSASTRQLSVTAATITTDLSAMKKQSRTMDAATAERLEKEEEVAGIPGAQFFGGNKQKAELYDPVAEEQANVAVFGDMTSTDDDGDTTYGRFQDATAFTDERVAAIAESLQIQINAALYEGAEQPESLTVQYAPSTTLQWTTPLAVEASSPLGELEKAIDFYNSVDVAIVSGSTLEDGTVLLNWEVALLWPVLWEARVMITGTSKLTINSDDQIVRQIDSLSDPSQGMLGTIGRQLVPRFWDLYHAGMTPSSQLMQRIKAKSSLFGGYQVYETAPRLISSPTMLDTGNRDDRIAEFLPNHAFSCVIKTMGPKRQRFVTVSSVEVRLIPQDDGSLRIKWAIPLSVEFQTNRRLAVPPTGSESDLDPDFAYEYEPKRLVATVAYGGGVQDPEVSDLRKKLYEKVTKDGYQPKLDANGRPQFFFVQNAAKSCFEPDGGLGMVVYEWRAPLTKPNEIGIELEQQ